MLLLGVKNEACGNFPVDEKETLNYDEESLDIRVESVVLHERKRLDDCTHSELEDRTQETESSCEEFGVASACVESGSRDCSTDVLSANSTTLADANADSHSTSNEVDSSALTPQISPSASVVLSQESLEYLPNTSGMVEDKEEVKEELGEGPSECEENCKHSSPYLNEPVSAPGSVGLVSESSGRDDEGNGVYYVCVVYSDVLILK